MRFGGLARRQAARDAQRDLAALGLGAQLITATHHSRHHTHMKTNFGLFFRTWDRWCGTDAMPPSQAGSTTTAVPPPATPRAAEPEGVVHEGEIVTDPKDKGQQA